MKILLIDPPGEQTGINAGLAWLSGSLGAQGIGHRVLDMVNGDPGDENLLEIASEYSPQYFGLSVKTATYHSSKRIAALLKSRFPETPILAGGPHATLYAEDLLSEIPHLDAVITGDAEFSLPRLLKSSGPGSPVPEVGGLATRQNGGVRRTARELPRDLDDLPFPDFDGFIGLDLAGHPYPLVTSRGCPHGCIYCSVGKVSGRRWRRRSPESVVRELMRAKERWGFTEFEVLDDTFTHDVERAREICRLLSGNDLGMQWSCPNGIRADRVTPELLADMKKAGCHTVIFGVETANPEVFESLRKGEKLSDVERAVRMAGEAGLRTGGYFIIGLPGDTYESTLAGLDYARRIGLDWAHFNLLAPYPGTGVWDMIESRGRFLDDWRATRHFGARPRPIFELDGYPAEEMAKAYRAVHTRQGLYHLVLPRGLPPTKRKAEIRKLRLKYDRRGWWRDVKRDAKAAAASPVVLARVGARELFTRIGVSPNNKTPPRITRSPGGKESLRVLMVNDHGGRAGGTERYIADVARLLEAGGNRVAWAYEKAGDWSGLDFGRYKIRGLWEKADPKLLERDLEAVAKDFRPDIIHIHNVQFPEAMRICSRLAPSVRTVHDHNFTCPSMNRMWATGRNCAYHAGWMCIDKLLDGGCAVIGKRPTILLERLARVLDGLKAASRLKRVLVATEFMAGELKANGVDPSSIKTLPLFTEFPENASPPDDSLPFRVLWAGRLVMPDKGPDQLLEALYYMHSPWEAVIAGAGPAGVYLKRKSRELGIGDRVKFAGNISPARMEEEYRRCHAVAFTGMWQEPFGYVGIEAAAHARPVVAFDVGAVKEWLADGEGGYLVPRGNNKLFALRLEWLARDPRLRGDMGRANRRRAMEKFDKRNHVDQLMQVYGEALAS